MARNQPKQPPPRPVPLAADRALDQLTSPDLAAAIRRAQLSYAEASTSAQVAAAYEQAIAVAEQLTVWAESNSDVDVEPILAQSPGLAVKWFAEGTVLVFSLDSDDWVTKALSTPQPDDDAFFALTSSAYRQANPGGYARWEVLTWDYGGCSGLGSGDLFRALTKADEATKAGPTFATHIEAIREAVVAHITRDNTSGWQLCDPATLEARSDDALRGEVQQILDHVSLSDTQRTALTRVQPTLTGEAFSGG